VQSIELLRGGRCSREGSCSGRSREREVESLEPPTSHPEISPLPRWICKELPRAGCSNKGVDRLRTLSALPPHPSSAQGTLLPVREKTAKARNDRRRRKEGGMRKPAGREGVDGCGKIEKKAGGLTRRRPVKHGRGQAGEGRPRRLVRFKDDEGGLRCARGRTGRTRARKVRGREERRPPSPCALERRL
jgi:hypothetical protein